MCGSGRARVWAVEGENGVGRPLAARLLADGETVWDVPAKLAARVRVFDSGHGRKADATDAHSVAMVALRTRGLRQLTADEDLTVLRLLADRRDEVSRSRNRTTEPVAPAAGRTDPGRRTAAPVGAAGQGPTRRRPAQGSGWADPPRVGRRAPGRAGGPRRQAHRAEGRRSEAVTVAGSRLMDIFGVGPAGAPGSWPTSATSPGFADRNRFASWTGSAACAHSTYPRPSWSPNQTAPLRHRSNTHAEDVMIKDHERALLLALNFLPAWAERPSRQVGAERSGYSTRASTAESGHPRRGRC